MYIDSLYFNVSFFANVPGFDEFCNRKVVITKRKKVTSLSMSQKQSDIGGDLVLLQLC